MSSSSWNTNTPTTTTSFPSPAYAQILQELGAEVLSPEFLDEYLPENRPDEVKKETEEERKPSMERIPNGSEGEINDQQAQQGMYYSQDPRMNQDRYNQMLASQSSGQGYSTDPQMSVRTPEMINGAPQTVQQQLTLEQQQQLAQRQAMMQRQYSSPALTGRQPINGNDQRSKSSQNLMGTVQQRPQEAGQATMNGMASASQMAMNQGGFISPTYAQQAPNGAHLQRQHSSQQLHAQQLQQQQYQQQMQQQSSSQQMTMSMQINSQMTQMNIQVGNQNTTQQQQQAMMQNQQLQQQQPQQYTQQQLQQMQHTQGQGQPQVHTAQQAQTLQQLQQSQIVNGQYTAYSNQMGMTQMGQGGSMMQHQQMQMSDQQLQLEQARLIRQRHPHLSQQARSASMGSLPLNQQQPPQYQYPYGQQPGLGQRPNGMNPFTANGTPVPANWLMAYQTEMPPAFLNHYNPGKPHPYFDHTRRNLQYPYPLGTKDLCDRPGEPFTFGFLPDSIYYNPANDRRTTKPTTSDTTNFVGPSTSKASPKKRGAAATGGAAAKKQRRTNSVDQADDVRFVQPYPPTMTAQTQMLQQRMVPTSSTAQLYASSSGQSYDGFTSPTLPMQQQPMIQQTTPHMQLQRQMSAPAYSGLAQSAQDAMQNARQQQAMANAQAQYAAQQQQQGPSSAGQMSHDGYQSPTGDGMYSEMQWRGQYTQQTVPSSASSSQQSFRSPQSTPQSFNGAQQPQQSQSSQQQGGSNEQMYWNQQQ